MYLEETNVESRDEDGIRIGKKKNVAKKDSNSCVGLLHDTHFAWSSY